MGGGVARRKGCGARWGNPNQSKTQSPGPLRRAGGRTQPCYEFPQQPGLVGVFICLRRCFPQVAAIIRQSAGGTIQSCCDFPQQPWLAGIFNCLRRRFPRAQQPSAGLMGERLNHAMKSPNSLALLEFFLSSRLLAPAPRQTTGEKEQTRFRTSIHPLQNQHAAMRYVRK